MVDLRDLSQEDAHRTGAKAANEAALLQAGLRVPEGFVLTTEAFVRFVEASPLEVLKCVEVVKNL